MDYVSMMNFINQYGLIFLFVVVFMEYLNLPGFPAGVIFPTVGIWIKYYGKSFMTVFIVSIIAGLLGSLILYIVGLKGGTFLLDKICAKRPRLKAKMDKYIAMMDTKANLTVFIAKLIPMVRTLIGFPAGAIKMNVKNYLFFSALGIAIWNGVLILSGFIIGEAIFR